MHDENVNQAWLHALELIEDLVHFNDAELIECREAMLLRAREIMKRLDPLVPEDMSEEEATFL